MEGKDGESRLDNEKGGKGFGGKIWTNFVKNIISPEVKRFGGKTLVFLSFNMIYFPSLPLPFLSLPSPPIPFFSLLICYPDIVYDFKRQFSFTHCLEFGLSELVEKEGERFGQNFLCLITDFGGEDLEGRD